MLLRATTGIASLSKGQDVEFLFKVDYLARKVIETRLYQKNED